MIVKCKVCEVKKNRTHSGMKNGRSIFMSSEGRWYNASVCPPCLKRQQKSKPIVKPDDSHVWEAPKYHKYKGCPKCDGPMELSRYFSCMTCKPEIYGHNDTPLDIYV